MNYETDNQRSNSNKKKNRYQSCAFPSHTPTLTLECCFIFGFCLGFLPFSMFFGIFWLFLFWIKTHLMMMKIFWDILCAGLTIFSLLTNTKRHLLVRLVHITTEIEKRQISKTNVRESIHTCVCECKYKCTSGPVQRVCVNKYRKVKKKRIKKNSHLMFLFC